MLRRRSIRTAAAAIASTTTTATYTATGRGFNTSLSHIWITISSDNASPTIDGSRPWIMRVPLEVNLSSPFSSTSGQTVHGVLHRSRTLLAPQQQHQQCNSDDEFVNTTTFTKDEPRGPYDVTIDEALLKKESAVDTTTTVLDLVRLMVDPDAGPNVEAVSLRDFAAMSPKRQLRAVNNDHDCLSVLLSSERYQSERDARALRLVGITTLGQWREQPDRVPLSAYGRGVLDTAYNALARNRQQSQKDLVVAWLTRTIQRAVAEELMAPKQLPAGDVGAGAATPLLNVPASSVGSVSPPRVPVNAIEGAKPGVAVAAPTTTFASPEKTQMAKTTGEKEEELVEEVEEEKDATVSARRRGTRKRPVVPEADKPKVKIAATAEEETEEAVEGIMEDIHAEQGEEVDAEMADLMAEAEAILKKDGPPVATSAKSAAPAAVKAAAVDKSSVEQVKKNGGKIVENDAAEEVEEEVEEVVEEVEEVEEAPETEEKIAAAGEHGEKTVSGADVAAAAAAAAAATTPPAAPAASTTTAQKEKLTRLAELMLKQFNTADGYLHPTSKAERVEQEQRGEVLVLDEDTAQVDPLAMFSVYHAATVTDADPISVRALKTIWTSYNKHQVALEEARDEAAAEFYKHESVNALLYGSVLMRALAREESVVVLEGTGSLPRYGFPLVSSDTRPFNAVAAGAATSSTPVGNSSNNSSVTDMTPGKVPTAMQAYKIFFSDKVKRYSPFRPAIDRNAGCSVVRLSGTTLHLYYTSTKDHVMEEEVRMPFAEVMLGVLHLLRQKVLPRVNVVHYHLIATKLADASADTDFLLRSTATLDLTNPFTKDEHNRLKALAAPLGMAEEMDEFRCIDDLVIEIEDNSGASVVHSLLHNREDLEATLTATLAQLLPEDVEGEDAEKGGAEGVEKEVELVEEEEEEGAGGAEVEDAVQTLPTPLPTAAATAAATCSTPPPVEEDAYAEDDYGEEDEDEDIAEEDAHLVMATRGSKAHTPAKKTLDHPAPPVAPTTRRSAAAAAAAANEGMKGEEAELEEAIYTQWQKQKEQQHQQQQRSGQAGSSGGGGASGKRSTTARNAVAQVPDMEEELEEEEEVHTPPPAAHKARSPAQSRQQHHPSRTATLAATATPAAVKQGEEEDFEEEEVEEIEDADDSTEEKAQVLPRTPAGRRRVPVEEEEPPRRPATKPPPPLPPAQQHQRSARHQTPATPAAVAASAPSRTRAPPTPPVAAEDVHDNIREEEDGDDVPPPPPQVRKRRGAARLHSARARISVPAEDSVQEETRDVGSLDAVDDVPTDDDQWFRRKSKRRHFE